MTSEDGQTIDAGRTAEVDDYFEQVRVALHDLPPAARDDVLEHLHAHLTEVAADDPAPLRERLGSPQSYAIELHAAVDPSADQPRQPIAAWVRAGTERMTSQLRRLDMRIGRLIGYGRASEFGRLLVPAWWVLRGYLVAMVVTTLISGGRTLGLLPRLGDSVLAGLVILAAFVAGSIWVARREPHLGQWSQRAVLAGSAVVLLFGVVGFATLEGRHAGHEQRVVYTQNDRYDHVEDVYVLDAEDQLLTNVRLLDQHGTPIDIGGVQCHQPQPDHRGHPVITYPRCPERLPWWPLQPQSSTTPAPEPSGLPSPIASPVASPTASPTVTSPPTPSTTGSPAAVE